MQNTPSNEEWSVQITGKVITGFDRPHSVDRKPAEIEVLKAEEDEIRVRIDDKEYSTNDPEYSNHGRDPIASVVSQVMMVVDDQYSDYLHNYVFRGGRAYDEESPGGGHHLCG